MLRNPLQLLTGTADSEQGLSRVSRQQGSAYRCRLVSVASVGGTRADFVFLSCELETQGDDAEVIGRDLKALVMTMKRSDMVVLLVRHPLFQVA